MKTDDITVTLTAVDRVSPVLKRIGRRLWWMQYGGLVTTLLVAALVVAVGVLGFVIGRFV